MSNKEAKAEMSSSSKSHSRPRRNHQRQSNNASPSASTVTERLQKLSLDGATSPVSEAIAKKLTDPLTPKSEPTPPPSSTDSPATKSLSIDHEQKVQQEAGEEIEYSIADHMLSGPFNDRLAYHHHHMMMTLYPVTDTSNHLAYPITAAMLNMNGTKRRSGHVKFFNSQKGYGFIIPNDPSEVNVNGRRESECRLLALWSHLNFL